MELVDLDGVDARIPVAVLQFCDGFPEGLIELYDTAMKDILESDEYGERDTALDQHIDDAPNIDGGFLRGDDNVAIVIDRKIAVAPCAHEVLNLGVDRGPARSAGSGLLGHVGKDQFAARRSSTYVNRSGATMVASDSIT